MNEIISSSASGRLSLIVLSKAYKTLKRSFHNIRIARLETFLRCLDVQYETLSSEDRSKLESYINSPAGQEILSDYVEAITQCKSERVNMSLALVYCDDRDFALTDQDKATFINGTIGLTDAMVDYYVAVSRLTAFSKTVPYERYSISDENYNALGLSDLDAESVFSYTHELIRRQLLLPDHVSSSYVKEEGWGIMFGQSKRTQKFARLLEKAGVILDFGSKYI